MLPAQVTARLRSQSVVNERHELVEGDLVAPPPSPQEACDVDGIELCHRRIVAPPCGLRLAG